MGQNKVMVPGKRSATWQSSNSPVDPQAGEFAMRWDYSLVWGLLLDIMRLNSITKEQSERQPS
jgi:hypothetical protein